MHMSFKSYKKMDIIIFMVLAFIFEFVNYYASTSFESFQLIFMSFSVVISLICMYRWGIIGALCALSGALAACFAARSNDYSVYIAYMAGNVLGVILPYLLFIKVIGRKKLEKYKILLYVYYLCDFFLVIILRCFIIALFSISTFGSVFRVNLAGTIIAESMSLAMSLIILMVASRKKGNLVVEMKSYIKEVQDNNKLGHLKQYKESPNFNMDKPYTEQDEIDEAFLLDGGKLSKKQLEELDELFKEDVEKNEG